MPSESSSTEFIDLTDFTAGIKGGWRTASANEPAPDGAAQIRDTWGCVAHPVGGLEPGPRRVATKTLDVTTTGAALTLPTGAPRQAKFHDLVVVPSSNLTDFSSDPTIHARIPDMVLVATERFTLDGTDKRWGATLAWHDQSNDVARNTVGLTGPDGTGPGIPAFDYAVLAEDSWLWGGLTATVGRTGPLKSPSVIVSGWHMDSGTFLRGGFNWPDHVSGTPTVAASPAFADTTWWDLNLRCSVRAVYHQSRAVISIIYAPANSTPTEFYSDDEQAPFSDQFLAYSKVNGIFERNITDLDQGILGLDTSTPDSIGVINSMNTTELFIVMNRTGGIVVRDALEAPTVTRFPGVESTGNYPSHGCIVPGLGLVYGTASGVFAWNGGNQSVQLSKGLEGLFWLTSRGTANTVRHPNTPVGKFAYRHPYIYAPNNWLMDTRTGGWFRLYPSYGQGDANATLGPTVAVPGIELSMFATGHQGNVYATQPEQHPVGDTVTYHDEGMLYTRFDPTLGASTFSWRSQPLVRQLRGRQLKFRELDIVLQGNGTVKVTLFGLGGTTQTKTVTVNSTSPEMQRVAFDVEAYDVEMMFVSQGHLAGGGAEADRAEAPRILRASLGYREHSSSNRG